MLRSARDRFSCNLLRLHSDGNISIDDAARHSTLHCGRVCRSAAIWRLSQSAVRFIDGCVEGLALLRVQPFKRREDISAFLRLSFSDEVLSDSAV